KFNLTRPRRDQPPASLAVIADGGKEQRGAPGYRAGVSGALDLTPTNRSKIVRPISSQRHIPRPGNEQGRSADHQIEATSLWTLAEGSIYASVVERSWWPSIF